MKQIKSIIKNEIFLSCLLILVVAAIAYLPQVGRLGYYGDDWQTAYAGYTYGPQKIAEIFTTDRPFQGIVYALDYILLGNQPIVWQLWAFLQRMIGALTFFWIGRMLWPRQKVATTSMAVLFALYPGFLLMPNAHTYQTLLTAVNLGMLSIATTLKAILSPQKWRYAIFALSGLLAMGCVFMFEWMIGIEGLRFGLIWFVLGREKPSKFWPKVKSTILHWLPAIVGVGLFLLWRLLLFKSTRPQTNLGAIAREYLAQPLQMILRIPTEMFKGISEATITAWFYPFYNLIVKLNFADLFLTLLAGLAGGALIFLGLRFVAGKWKSSPEEPETAADDWTTPAILIGIMNIVVALAPVVVLDRAPSLVRDTYDRYFLTSMIGIVLLVGGIIFKLASKLTFRLAIVTFLAVLAIMTHFSNASNYADVADYHNQFWWQFSWRAPDLKDGTQVMPLLKSGYRFMDAYDILPEVNLIYRPTIKKFTLMGYVLNAETSKLLFSGAVEHASLKTNLYDRQYQKSLVVSYGDPSGIQSCVHVWDPAFPDFSLNEDPIVPLTAPYSNISQIDVNATPHQPEAVFFGGEPAHIWCYYYEKASLARQQGNWQEAARLGQEAASQKFTPADLSEWMPFLEGYANTGQLNLVKQTAGFIKQDSDITFSLCRQFKPGSPVPPGFTSGDAFNLIASNLCN